MSDTPESGSEALQWLDENMVECTEAPDEAFDWVFMLKTHDWPLLASIWLERPAEWREACAYILGQGPVERSQQILRMALADDSLDVASEAAFSLCEQMLRYPDKAPFDVTLVPRLRELARLDPPLLKEVDELLRRYGA